MTDTEMLGKIFDKINGMDQKFDAIDQRFDAIDKRFDAMDQRMDKMDQKIDSIDGRVTNLELSLENDINKRINIVAENHLELNKKLDKLMQMSRTNRLYQIKVDYLESTVNEIKGFVGLT